MGLRIHNVRNHHHSRKGVIRLELRLSWASTSPAGFVLGSYCKIALLDDFLTHVIFGMQQLQALLGQLDGPLFQLAETTRCRYVLEVEGHYYTSRIPEIQDALPSLMPKMYSRGITVVEVALQDED